MDVILVKIWVVLLVVLELMLFVQAVGRAILYFRGKSASVDWTRYNIVMLSLLAVAFFPVTLAYLYITRL